MKELVEFAKVSSVEGSVFISFTLNHLMDCDEMACGSLKVEVPDFIIPVIFDESNLDPILRYSVHNDYIAIDSMESTLKIQNIIYIYRDFIRIIKECPDWYLSTSGFCYDIKYVYIDKKYNKIKFIYVPDKTEPFDLQNIKFIMLSLLEKCDETSGGNIQLQLYKYFYKPKFDIFELEKMLDKFEAEAGIKKHAIEQAKKPVDNKGVVTPRVAPPKEEKIPIPTVKSQEIPKIIPTKATKVEEKQIAPKPATPVIPTASKQETKGIIKPTVGQKQFYPSKPNPSQLSQDEIEEMVKSIYSGAAGTTNTPAATEKEAKPQQSALKEPVKPVIEPIKPAIEPAAIPNIKPKDTEEANVKVRGILSTMFGKGSKDEDGVDGLNKKMVKLKLISLSTRYDLPKEIDVKFKDGHFIIGRETRNGESTGADYEFSNEIIPISRLHAKISVHQGGFYLEDLGSSNGTFINSTKIEPYKPYKIEDGDKIAFAIAYLKNSIEYTFVE